MAESGVSAEVIVPKGIEVGDVSSNNSLEGVVLGDLNIAVGPGKVSEKNIGSVLGQLRGQIERGISLDRSSIKAVSSTKEALPADLLQAMQTNVVRQNELPQEDDEWGNKLPFFRDEVLGKTFDGDAYADILTVQQKLYGERANVKLVRYNGTLVTVTEHIAGDRLKVTQVVDADFPPTAEYREFQRKVREENADPAAWKMGERKKEQAIPTHHLIVEDIKTGKAIDLKTLLPDDWSLKYKPTTEIGLAFSVNTEGKYLRYAELSSPELLVGFFHEYGHGIIDANDSPELYQEAKELWEQSRLHTGGPTALPETVFNRTKELVVRAERGASSRALQALRILRDQGIDIGAPVNKIIDITNKALDIYEKNYSGGTTSFIHAGKKAA